MGFCSELSFILSSLDIIAKLATSRVSSIPRIKRLLGKLVNDSVHRDYYIKELTRILNNYYRNLCLSDKVILYDPYRDLGYYDIAVKLVTSGECHIISSNDSERRYRCYDGIEVTFWYHENGEGAMVEGRKDEILKLFFG